MVVPWALERIPRGDLGTDATIARMATLARWRSLDPAVRAKAVEIVRYLDGRAPALQARYLRDWIDDRVQFLPDPTLVEALHDPVEVLMTIARHGIARVDCDDVATLAAALGLSIGLRPRFVVAAFSPKPHFAHVWTEFATPAGWMPVDPTRPLQVPTMTRTRVYPLT